ncbi:putative NTPase [Etheostoma fonticola aquareovirus]|uniref:putative NTPase n=1 Tax=Etheostoma fonticola aquareovirus TaxID=1862978 RepID=UPI0007F06D28|nr:putative NTPase [Etheostoma fonticola aquareovirus]ANN11950.1 putative NTPase [Etheostoma fonticola aquareovirus]
MITVVFIPGHGFNWNDSTLLKYIDSRLYRTRIPKDTLTLFAPVWFKAQLEHYVGTHGIEEVYAWCQKLTSPLTNRFILLPRPKSFARWLLSTPSANVWEIPRWKLDLAAAGKAPPDLYDSIQPLLGPDASVSKSVTLIASHPIVYSRTRHVFGGPLYLATDVAAYSGFITQSALDAIFKHDADVPSSKRSAVHITILPNLTNVRAFMLDVPDLTLDPDYPLSAFQGHLTRIGQNTTRMMPLDGLCWRLTRGSAKPTWTPEFDEAFRLLRLSRPAVPSTQPNFGTEATLVHVDLTLRVDARDNKAPRAPLHVHVINVPLAYLTLMGLKTDQCYPLRTDDGNTVPWFLVLVLLSDGVLLAGTRRPVLLQTSIAELQPWWEVTLNAFLNPHAVTVRSGVIKDIMGVALALPKGSYKSTFIDVITAHMENPDAIFPQATVTDSDDLGDSLTPTFETQIMDIWQGLGVDLLEQGVRAILTPGAYGAEFPIQIFQEFSKLYHEVMLPAQRGRASYISQRGRSLVYVHTPYEIVSANVPMQVAPCQIALDSMVNVLIRHKRVGGVTGQVLLDHCYRLMGATTAPQFAGLYYRSLFAPWLELAAHPTVTLPIRLETEVSAHTLREVGWSVHGDDPLLVIILEGLIPADSLYLTKLPQRVQSRASIVVTAVDDLRVSLSPPLPTRMVHSTILLPVTSVVRFDAPARILLSGTSISVRGPVTWTTTSSPVVE